MNKTIAVIMILAVGAMAGDRTGTWTGSFRAAGSDHDIPQLFILKQEGRKLSGTGGPDAQEQYPIENGRVSGDRVQFELTTGEWRFTYDLKQAGEDVLKGDLALKSLNNSATATVSLTKKQ